MTDLLKTKLDINRKSSETNVLNYFNQLLGKLRKLNFKHIIVIKRELKTGLRKLSKTNHLLNFSVIQRIMNPELTN